MPTPSEARRVFEIARDYATDHNRQIIVSSDRDFQRHRQELVGGETPVDLTPLTVRKPAPGHVLVEWIGDRGPAADAQIRAAARLGALPPNLAQAIERSKLFVSTRVDGVTRRIVNPGDGFSRQIIWGPKHGSYVQELTFKDADLLFSTGAGHEFRYWENGQVFEVYTVDLIARYIPASLQPVVRNVRIHEGAEERLLGLQVKNGVVDPRSGYYE